LLRAAAGLLDTAGFITLGGTPLPALARPERARRLAYLPQGHVIHWPLPAAEVVALGRLPRGSGADLSDADRVAVERAMVATGTIEFADRPVTALSGGERARIALARVLATEAPLILADEPTVSLDPRYQLQVMTILRRHADEGGAVVAVLHDLTLAARVADRLVLLDHGRVAADGPPRKVLADPRLEQAFGMRIEVVEAGGATAVLPVAS
jgi:iron complex transport system ATP-binding protein